MKRFFLISLIIVLSAAATGYWIAFGSNTPAFEDVRSIKIPRSSSFSATLDSLHTAGLLRRPSTFQLMAYASGWWKQIKPGHYSFESGVSNYDVLNRLRKGLQTPIRVTIPPGSRPEVVAAVLQRSLDLDADSFLEHLRNPALCRTLDTDTLHLFGQMLPNTYQIYWTTDARGVVRRLKQEYDRFFDDSLRARADALRLTPNEVLRLASIVQWEARLDEEKATIAGVYLNRLARNMRLQADPTVQYALMQADGGPMRRLLYADYAFRHPFNTYIIDGLPPGVINNPAPSSIRAVLYPEKHSYIYFVADGTGRHAFSRTLAEHNRKAQDYRRLMRARRRAQQQGQTAAAGNNGR